jgi:hypothetical protein
MSKETRDETIELILDHLFTNGDKVKGDRLLLITEDYSGAAKVSNARYLGGYSRPAIRNLLQDALREEEATGMSVYYDVERNDRLREDAWFNCASCGKEVRESDFVSLCNHCGEYEEGQERIEVRP